MDHSGRATIDDRALPYSPALDGLRAVAVSVILLYHGGAAWLPGGFLGVDLFFVLSGFLITSLLLLEWEARGSLRLGAFWGRRARRLLPALLLMLSTLAAAAMLIGGEFAASVRTDGLAALFYISNWWFIAEGTGYAEQFADPSPLQHTWSLAIEEQWYLLLPVALVAVLPRIRSRQRLAALLAVGALVSAFAMLLLAPADGSDPSRVYFGTDTRVQALLVGSVLACLAPQLPRGRGLPAAAWGSVLLAVAAFLLVGYRTEWMYRGGYLMLAVAFAAVLADVIARPSGALARTLALPPLVWVGRISYGLYLWHWPVYLILTPERMGMSGLPLLAVRLAVTFAISIASYRWVERPIRHGALTGLATPRRVGAVVAAPAMVAALLIVAPAIGPQAQQQSLVALAAQAGEAEVSDSEDPRTAVVIVGDSQALALQTQFDPADAPAISPSLVTEFECGLIPYDSAIGEQRMTLPPKCYNWTPQAIEEQVAASAAEVGVLMAGSWEQYDRWESIGPLRFTDPRWSRLLEADYRERLEVLGRHTESIAVLLNHCHGAPDFDVPLDLQFGAGRYPPVTNDPRRIAAVNDAITTAAAQVDFPVEIIDLNPLLCPDGYTEKLDGVQLRTDGLHLTAEGAAIVWRFLGPRLRELAESS